jgi:polyadenylation factor subunit 2
MKITNRNNFIVTSDKTGVMKVSSLGFNNEIKEKGGSNACSGDSIRSFAFSPNEKKMSTAHEDKSIRLWDFSTLEVERKLEGHGSDVVTIEWHPSKALLVSGGKDRLVKFWDPLTGKNICNLFNHTNTINKIKFNKNENFLVSSGKDQLVRVYDIRMMKECMILKGHNSEVTDIEWHPLYENHLISADSESRICYWVLPFSTPVNVQVHQKGFGVVRSAFDPLGMFVASVANDRQMKLWDVCEQDM